MARISQPLRRHCAMASGRKLGSSVGARNALTRGVNREPITPLIGDIRQVLAEADDRFQTAKRSGDIDAARSSLIAGVWRLHDVLAQVTPGANLLLTAIEPLIFALLSSRHWLVGLPGDYVPLNAHADVHRQRIKLQAAAILQHFAYRLGAKRGQGGAIASKIAAAVRRGRMVSPPSVRSIQDYRTRMRAPRNKQDKSLSQWFEQLLMQIADDDGQRGREEQRLDHWLTFLEESCRANAPPSAFAP